MIQTQTTNQRMRDVSRLLALLCMTDASLCVCGFDSTSVDMISGSVRLQAQQSLRDINVGQIKV